MNARDHMQDAPVAPIFIGPKNASHVVGHGWRWCRDTAHRLGVPVVYIGRKPLIPAAPFRAALNREAAGKPQSEPTHDARAELARRLEAT